VLCQILTVCRLWCRRNRFFFEACTHVIHQVCLEGEVPPQEQGGGAAYTHGHGSNASHRVELANVFTNAVKPHRCGLGMPEVAPFLFCSSLQECSLDSFATYLENNHSSLDAIKSERKDVMRMVS